MDEPSFLAWLEPRVAARTGPEHQVRLAELERSPRTIAGAQSDEDVALVLARLKAMVRLRCRHRRRRRALRSPRWLRMVSKATDD